MPETEEVIAAYETQKVVIAQLQEQLNDEKMRNTEIESDLRDEIDRLSKTCSDQQQLIHQGTDFTDSITDFIDFSGSKEYTLNEIERNSPISLLRLPIL